MSRRPWEGSGLKLSQAKTGLIQGGRKKVHCEYQNELEMVEEFDVITDKLLVRKWRVKRQLGGEGEWEFEYGGDGVKGNDFLMERSTQPMVTRVDTDQLFEWRIRNLPYPKEVYQVTAETPVDVVVRTTNKKFFKKLLIPDMLRLGLSLDASSLTWTYSHNTLVISYIKPPQILEQEKKDAKERNTMKCMRA